MSRKNHSNFLVLWRPGRLTKVIVCIVAGLVALFSVNSQARNNWAMVVLMAAIALILPTLQFRSLWQRGRFWITVSLLAITQVPLVIIARSHVQQFGSLFVLAFGVGDGIFVIYVIAWVCISPEEKENYRAKANRR